MSSASIDHRQRKGLKALDAVYAAAGAHLQGWTCARSGDCCQLAKAGREPWVWPVELLRVTRALALRGEPIPPERPDGACPLLNPAGACSVYADRPLGCRTFFCDRGHGPTRLSRETITQLMVRVERISSEVDPEVSSPRPLAALLGELRAAGSAPGAPPPPRASER